jgi:hypothetical protein
MKKLAIILATCLALAATASAQTPETAPGGQRFRFLIGGSVATYTDFGTYFSMQPGLDLAVQYDLARCPIPDGQFKLRAGLATGWYAEAFRQIFVFDPQFWPVIVPILPGIETALQWNSGFAVFVSFNLGGLLQIFPDTPPRPGFLSALQIGCEYFPVSGFGLRLGVGWGLFDGNPLWGGPQVSLAMILSSEVAP